MDKSKLLHTTKAKLGDLVKNVVQQFDCLGVVLVCVLGALRSCGIIQLQRATPPSGGDLDIRQDRRHLFASFCIIMRPNKCVQNES